MISVRELVTKAELSAILTKELLAIPDAAGSCRPQTFPRELADDYGRALRA